MIVLRLPLTSYIKVYLTDAEKAQILAASKASRLTASAWCRERLVAAVRK